MADLSKFLPLSQRGNADESAVSTDRHLALAQIIEDAASIVQAHAVEDERDDLALRFVADARLTRDVADEVDGRAAAWLSDLATRVRAGAKRSIRSLADGARAVLLLAERTGSPPRLDAATAGAVALYAATSGPFERRVVVAGHTVRASDAGWEFGRGPVLQATATEIAAFVLGVSDTPPAPVSSRG